MTNTRTKHQGIGWTLLRILIWAVAGFLALFTIIGTVSTFTGPSEQRTVGIVMIIILTAAATGLVTLAIRLRPKGTPAQRQRQAIHQAPATPPTASADVVPPAPVRAPDPLLSPGVTAASTPERSLSRREMRERAQRSAAAPSTAPMLARGVTPSSSGFTVTAEQARMVRVPRSVDENGNQIVRAAYASGNWDVGGSSGYAFLWKLKKPPYVGQRVFIPGHSGPRSKGVIVGFGRNGYRGPLKKVAGVPLGQPVKPVTDAASARGAGERDVLTGGVELVEARPQGDVLVVGEQYHQAAWSYLLQGGVEQFRVVLVPEPENPHGDTPIRVDVLLDGALLPPAGGSLMLGYVASEDSTGLFPLLEQLRAQGVLLTAGAKFWHGERVRRIYVAIDGDATSMFDLIPPVAPDGIGTVWAAERSVVVTGEEHHQAELDAHGAGTALFQMTTTRVEKGKNQGDLRVGVLLDGAQIGQLTALQSSNFLEKLQHAVAAHGTVWAEGRIEADGARGWQATLRLPKVS